MREIYLDNAATTPVLPEVAAAVSECLSANYGNPSSAHAKGIQAEGAVREARAHVARALGARPAEIVFTSGGTESNNLAIKGAARAHRRRGRHLITSRIEHPSVLNAMRDLEEEGFRVSYLPVDREGRVDLQDVAAALTEDTLLVSIMLVNNEVGTVQAVAEVSRLVRRVPGALLHVDAVQAFGKMDLRPRSLGVDLLSISGHKLHGPKGIGALFVAEGTRLQPLFGGGEQGGGLRAGTENVPGIAGLGAAARLAHERLGEATARMAGLRTRLIESVLRDVPDARLNGPGLNGPAAPHIVNFSFPGVRGEVLLHALEERGIYVSTGAACSSRKAVGSHVLRELGLSEPEAESAIRISLSPLTTGEDIDTAVAALKAAVADLRQLVR